MLILIMSPRNIPFAWPDCISFMWPAVFFSKAIYAMYTKCANARRLNADFWIYIKQIAEIYKKNKIWLIKKTVVAFFKSSATLSWHVQIKIIFGRLCSKWTTFTGIYYSIWTLLAEIAWPIWEYKPKPAATFIHWRCHIVLINFAGMSSRNGLSGIKPLAGDWQGEWQQTTLT